MATPTTVVLTDRAAVVRREPPPPNEYQDFARDTEPGSPAGAPADQLRRTRVVVLNASGVAGAATASAANLRASAVIVVRVGNAPQLHRATTAAEAVTLEAGTPAPGRRRTQAPATARVIPASAARCTRT